jgi:hypothetical protein
MKTVFQVIQKIVAGFAAIVSVSHAIVSDTRTTVCVPPIGVCISATADSVVLTAVADHN